jgi:Flp pilus assembly protein TadG
MMRPPRLQQQRRGATAVEAAIIVLVFLIVVLGMIDLGVGIFRYHTLAEASRIAAREAIVHGSLALDPWNSGTADSQMHAKIKPFLDAAGVDARVTASYLDQGNRPGNRVQVTVAAPYQPILTSIVPGGPVTLSATATMIIAH